MTKLYSFDLSKCMQHFANKYVRIKRHLATRYVESNKGMILETRKSGITRGKVIK